VLDLAEAGNRLPADALGRRVRGEQLGVLALEGAQLVKQRVVGVVCDLGVVEDVIAVTVVRQLLAQLGGAAGGWAVNSYSATSSAAGCSSAARS